MFKKKKDEKNERLKCAADVKFFFFSFFFYIEHKKCVNLLRFAHFNSL